MVRVLFDASTLLSCLSLLPFISPSGPKKRSTMSIPYSRPEASIARFKLYLTDIRSHVLNAMQHVYRTPSYNIKPLLNTWEEDMVNVFNSKKPLSSDPAEDLRWWRMLELALLELADLPEVCE